MFDNIKITAYGEKVDFRDLCQTIVKGNNLLLVKIFDEAVKTEVIKALENSDFDLSCTMEGKDIRVKLGTTKKEFIDAALSKIKHVQESFKRDLKEVKAEMMSKIKKLEKILPQE